MTYRKHNSFPHFIAWHYGDVGIAAKRERRGLVLLIVLVVVAILSLAAFTFAELMLTEHKAARLVARQAQTQALVESGSEMLRLYLAQTPTEINEAGGMYDNPARFQGMLVSDDGTLGGRVAIVAPRVEQGLLAGVRFGIEDESARLNINTLLFAEEDTEGAGRSLLMALPGMDESIADAILDWLDEDDEPREFGAELEHYSGLSPPYAAKNGPLDTLEELLLVRGVTPDLLFGADVNRNGIIDPSEQGRANLAEAYGADEEVNRGWAAYLTLHGKEANVQPDGMPRIDLNADDLQQLHTDLSAVFDAEWANFIVAYRQNGPYTGNKSGQSASGLQLDLSAASKTKFTQVLDLVGAKTQMKLSPDDKEPTQIESPFVAEPGAAALYLPKLLDHVAVNAATSIPGRVNINAASKVVLLGIPGMTTEMVDEIIAERKPDPKDENAGRLHETWLYSEGLVDLQEMRALMPFVTGQGSVFRAQLVGYFDDGGPAARVEAIIDASETLTGPARIVFWRDMSHLGRGYPLETLGVGASE